MKDKSWTDTQEPEFIKVLEDLSKSVFNLATRTYILTDIIDKFYEAVVSVFSEGVPGPEQSEQNGNVYQDPTQTPVAEESA